MCRAGYCFKHLQLLLAGPNLQGGAEGGLQENSSEEL